MNFRVESTSRAAAASPAGTALRVTGTRSFGFNQIENGAKTFTDKVRTVFAAAIAHDGPIPANFRKTAEFRKLSPQEQALFTGIQSHLVADTLMGDLLVRATYAGEHLGGLLPSEQGKVTTSMVNAEFAKPLMPGIAVYVRPDMASMWQYLQATAK